MLHSMTMTAKPTLKNERVKCRIISWFISIYVSSINGLLPCLGIGQATWKFLAKHYNCTHVSALEFQLEYYIYFFGCPLFVNGVPKVEKRFSHLMHLHCFPARFHAIGMEPLWWIHFVLFFIFILGQDTVLFYLNFMRRGKRPATAANGSSNVASKKGRWAGGLQTQLVNRALEGLSHGWEKSEMD